MQIFSWKLTDFRGEPYPYDKDATWPDEYGVLATALEEDHAKYLKVFPEDIKGQIKDYYKKKWTQLFDSNSDLIKITF